MFKRFLPFLIIISMFITTGCSTHLSQIFKKKAVLSNLPQTAILTDGSSIQKQTISLLNSAQKSIYVEQALFDDPVIIDLLINKARAGLEVKVLLDQWQHSNKSTLDTLKTQNISVQFFPARKGQYDRVKLMVIDQNKALVYGPSWTATDWQKGHDIAVELNGRSAWRAATVFARDWEFTTTLALNVPKTSNLPDDFITLATNANLKQQISEKIQQVNKSIWIESSEVSEPDTVQALIDAAGKGKDVRVILDQESAKATPLTVEKLKSGGVKLRYYKSPNNLSLNLHVGIFDDKTFILTSSDWTYYTFVINHEFSITVPSPDATSKLISIFSLDWTNATPI